MVEEQDIMQHDENNNSDENAILTALTLAIKDVMRYEGKLLEIQCSERAIVHWLANYFMKHIAETDFVKKHKRFLLCRDIEKSCIQADDFQLGYTVDVEYNRIGAEGESKRLEAYCQSCNWNGKCSQKTEEEHLSKNTVKQRTAMLDMVFHQRRRNNQASNVFCLEVKTTSTKKEDYERYCDYKRIRDLVTKNSTITPQYQFGAAVHIYSVTEADVWFFIRDKDEAQYIKVTL